MTADGTDEAQTTAKRRRFTWRHALGVGVAIAVVVATFVFILPKIADYRDVWGVVKGLSWKDIALLVGATILNLVTFAPPWMAALPGLRFRQAFVVTQASTASTYVAPGGVAVGMALSFAMLRAWGFVSAAVGLAVALTGVWNQLSMLAFPTLALVLLTFTGDAHTALDTVAFLGLAIFLVVVAAFAAALSTPRLAATHRRPRGADRVVGQASDPQKASRVGRRVVRPLPGPRRTRSSSAGGTCSRSPRSRATSRSSSCCSRRFACSTSPAAR